MSVVIEQTRIEPMPDGQYLAKVSEISVDDGQYGSQVRWTFIVLKPYEYEGKQLVGWCSAKFNVKTKLYEWVKAAVFLGAAIPPDWRFDSAQVVGRTVWLLVLKEQRNDGSEYNRINKLLPYRPNDGQTNQQQAPVEEQPEWSHGPQT